MRGVLGAIGGLLSACSATPAIESVAPPQVSVATSDDGIRLTLTLGAVEVQAGEAIPLRTTLAYPGPRPSINVEGATDLVTIGSGKLIGDPLQGASWNLDCSDHIMVRGEVVEVALHTSASWC